MRSAAITSNSQPAPKPQAKRRGDKRKRAHLLTPDGTAYFANRNEMPLCDAFRQGGCDTSHPSWPTVCIKNRTLAHQCSGCLWTHSKSSGCTRTPADNPGAAARAASGGSGGGGKGGGKGRGKGRGRKGANW